MTAQTQISISKAHPIAAPAVSQDIQGRAPVEARDLIGDGVTREISLDGQIYTLRITKLGKLILTK